MIFKVPAILSGLSITCFSVLFSLFFYLRFGFGLTIVPVLSSLYSQMPLHTILQIVGCTYLFVGCVTLVFFYANINWLNLKKILIFTLPGVFVGCLTFYSVCIFYFIIISEPMYAMLLCIFTVLLLLLASRFLNNSKYFWLISGFCDGFACLSDMPNKFYMKFNNVNVGLDKASLFILAGINNGVRVIVFSILSLYAQFILAIPLVDVDFNANLKFSWGLLGMTNLYAFNGAILVGPVVIIVSALYMYMLKKRKVS